MLARFRTLTLAAVLVVLAAPGEAAVKRMFVTSASGSAKLSTWPGAGGQVSLLAGDTICRNLAQAAGLPNANAYVAWLSTIAVDAYCRVAGFDGQRVDNCDQGSLPNAGPWVRTDGKPFSPDLQTLTGSNAVYYPPFLDENGDPVDNASLHTGTEANGALYLYTGQPADCAGWTSEAATTPPRQRVGIGTSGSFWWTSSFATSCNSVGRLACFEPGVGDPLPDHEQPGAYAFVTSVTGSGDLGSWPEAGNAVGLDAGDAICRARAAAAGLPFPSSFVAWLSAGSTDAFDRLPAGVPFQRLDGVRIASGRAALVTPFPSDQVLQSAPDVSELGTYLGNQAVTGTNSDGNGSGADCSDWTSASAGLFADYGFPLETRGSWTDNGSTLVDCDGFYRLYCFSMVVTLFRDGFESGNATRWSNY